MILAEPWSGPEARQDRNPWGHSLTFAASVATVLTFTQFWQMPLTGPNGDPDASGLIRSLYFPAYGVALLMALMTPWSSLKTAVRQPLLWVLVADVLISTFWSIDPTTTERRGVALVFTTLAAMAIAQRFEWPALLEVFATAFAVVVVSCFILAIFVPSYGRMPTIFPGAWRGVWEEKNALGDYMTVGFMVFSAAAILNPLRRWLWVGFGFAAIALILLSTSKTSLVTLMIGSACLAFVWLAKRGSAISVAATFAAVTVLLVLGVGMVFASDAVFALLGKDATLTGRTKIWAATMRVIQQRPWTGYGYASVWTDQSGWGPLPWITKWSGFRAHHAHNSWMETWLAQGYPGLVLWGLYFAEVWIRGIFAVYTRKGGYFALPFLAVYSLTTLTESVAFIYNDLMWVILVAMAFRLSMPERTEPSPGLATAA